MKTVVCMLTVIAMLSGIIIPALATDIEQQSQENSTVIQLEETAKTGLCKVKQEDGSSAWFFYKKNGTVVKEQWKKVDGVKYYFLKSGKAATGSKKIEGVWYIFDRKGRLFTPEKEGVVRVDGVLYCANKKGKALPGWHVIGKKVVYASKRGKCAAGERISYIKFTKKGYAKNADQAIAKIEACKFISKHTKKGWSRNQKFKACFQYVMWYTKFTPRWNVPGKFKKGWEYKAAVSMFQNKLKGNCHGMASTVAAVAKELGYKPYVWRAAEDHSFVKVNDRYYDNMHGSVFARRSMTEHWHVVEKFKF